MPSILMLDPYRLYSAGGSFSPLDLSPALWIDPSDASSVTISGSSGAYIGANGLVLAGSGANYATAADLAAYDLTAEMEIVVRAQLADWTPTGAQTLMSHINASTGMSLTVDIAGTLSLVTNAATSTSTVATGFTDGTAYWIKATYKDSTDEVKFWWAADAASEPGSWTQLGTTITQTSTLSASTAALFVGSLASASQVCSGTILRAILRSTIGGSSVFDADFESATPFVSAFTESALGAPVYVVSSTATSATASYGYVGPGGLTLSGASSQCASTPDSVATSIVGDIEIQAKFQVSSWTPAAGQHVVLGKTNAAGSITSYLLRLSSTGHPQILIGNANAANATLGYTATATIPSAGYAAGSPVWVKATLDVDNGATNSAAQFFTSPDGTTWTQLGSTVLGGAGVVAIYDGDGSLTVGRYGDYNGAQWFAGGVIMRAIVKNGIAGTTVFDADFTTAADYAASFVESSSNAATVTITATNTPANAAGACVSQINDKSGNARHLTQGTLANMPKYWNGQNGLNCLVFDGSNDYLTLGTLTLAQPFTCYDAFMPLSTSTPRFFSDGANTVQVYSSSNKFNLYSGGGLTAVATDSGGVFVHAEFVFNGASSAYYRNGSLDVSGNPGGNGFGSGLILGAIGSPIGTSNANMRQGEFVLVAAASSSDRASMEPYIRSKWGTP